MEPKDRLLRVTEVMELVSLSRVTLFRLRREGKFPQALQIGARAIRWRESDIRNWIESRQPAEIA